MSTQPQILTIDGFREKIREFRPVCKICGFAAHSLVAHLRSEHKLSAGQYAKQFPGEAIASPIAIEVLRSLGKEPQKEEIPLKEQLPKFVPVKSSNMDFLVDWKSKLQEFPVPVGSEEYIPSENPRFKFTDNAQSIVFGFVSGKNVFISGPTGCGKTDEAKQVFNRLGYPLRRANMHGDVTYGTFVGTMKANASGTYFDYGLLPKAMKAGYPVLLDEIDFTPANIASILFPVLERDSELFIPETGEHIKAAKGFCVIATGNTGGKGDSDGSFTGTEVLNTAFLDRFPIKLTAKYLPKEVEQGLIEDSSPGINPEFAKRVVALATEIRTAFLAGELAFTWSTRKVLDYVEFLPSMGSNRALDVTLRNWLDADDRPFVDTLLEKVALDKVSAK